MTNKNKGTIVALVTGVVLGYLSSHLPILSSLQADAASAPTSTGRSANIHPTKVQRQELRDLSDEGPVVMLNLLKFKANGGAEKYAHYLREFRALKKEGSPFHGVEMSFAGDCKHLIIGDEEWDRAILVTYPSKKFFLQAVASSEYQAISHLRTVALDDSVLYMIKQRQ